MYRFIFTIILMLLAVSPVRAAVLTGSAGYVVGVSAFSSTGTARACKSWNFTPVSTTMSSDDVTAMITYRLDVPSMSSAVVPKNTDFRILISFVFTRQGYNSIRQTATASVSSFQNVGYSGSDYYFNGNFSYTFSYPSESQWVALPVPPPPPAPDPDEKDKDDSSEPVVRRGLLIALIGLQSFQGALILGFVFVYGLKLR